MKHLFSAFAILTVLTVYSCATPSHTTQLVRDIQRDTIYMTSQQYDSIYIYKDRSIDYHPNSQSRITNQESLIAIDTVYLKDVSIEYRYNLVRDTIVKSRIDSIPYEVTVVETKEIQRPLTFFDHLTRAIFWILCGILFGTGVKQSLNRLSLIINRK